MRTAGLLALLTLACGPARAQEALVSDTFSGPDRLLTSADQRSPRSDTWEAMTGSLFVSGKSGSTGVPDDLPPGHDSTKGTGSAEGLYLSRREEMQDVEVAARVLVEGLGAAASTPPEDGDGARLVLRWRSPFEGYVFSVWRRDGCAAIEKLTSDGRVALTPPMELPPAKGWRKVRAGASSAPDGSTRLWLEVDGARVAAAVDRDLPAGPGRVGVWTRNARARWDDFEARSAAAALEGPPLISGVEAANVTDMLASVFWTTDRPSDGQVEYGTSASYGGATPVQRRLTTKHSAALSGLKPSTMYTFRVRSRGEDGRVAVSPAMTFTTALGPDHLPPEVAIVTPAPGAGLSGETQVSANATDDTRILGVQFKLDGTLIAAEVLEPPYFVTLDTRRFPDGTHVLTAAARDSAGHVVVSGPVPVVIRNGAFPPTN